MTDEPDDREPEPVADKEFKEKLQHWRKHGLAVHLPDSFRATKEK